MTKAKQVTYSQALSELEKLVGEMESDDIDVDALAEKVKRATFLIKFCRTRLRTADEEIKKVLDDLGEKAGADEGAAEEDNGY